MAVKKELQKLWHKTVSFLNRGRHARFKRTYFRENFTGTRKLIVFFVPAGTDKINGGILSICTLHEAVKNLKNLHGCDVVASFLPGKSETDYKYRKFENPVVIFTFSELSTFFPALDYAEFHIPEIMIGKFDRGNAKMKPFFAWADKHRHTRANILNQNDLLMPDAATLARFKQTFPGATMTLAHEKYTTPEKRAEYGMPMHHFSAWLNPVPYRYRRFDEKENLVLYSPDKIQWVPNESTVTKEAFLARLQAQLPHFRFVEVRNLKYDDYKDLASRAKFAISFGEGLDGYFIETVLSGGISFAVYNPYFFSEDLKEMPTLFANFDEMSEQIGHRIENLNEPVAYEAVHKTLYGPISEKYNVAVMPQKVKKYYLNELDLP